MVKKTWLILFLSVLLLLEGCWDQREINASAIPIALGVDLLENKQIYLSALFVQPRPPEQSGGESDTLVISASGRGVAMAGRRLMLSMSQVPEWAHVRTFILGEKLVRNDLSLSTDFMTRNRNIRPDMNLMVCSGANPEDILLQVKSLGNGEIREMVTISEQQAGIFVPITIGEFTYRLMTPGIEPAVPMLILQSEASSSKPEEKGDKNSSQVNKQERISLHKMAVFKRNKMAGTLNETESRGYRWLNSKYKRGGLFHVNSPLQDGNYVALEIIRFSSKTRPQISGDQIKMCIDIEADLSFYEAAGPGDLLSPPMIAQLENEAKLEITKQVSACIKRSQELNSDILGWGIKMQEDQPEEWQQVQSNWNEIFPHVEKEIHVKAHIKRAYLTRKMMEFK